jgi:hypothetical protein
VHALGEAEDRAAFDDVQVRRGFLERRERGRQIRQIESDL